MASPPCRRQGTGAVSVALLDIFMNRENSPPRAALYVDFDNVFMALLRWDERAAYAFGERPDAWLAWLEGRAGDGSLATRRTLVRRCYLNPAGYHDFQPGRAVARYRLARELRNRCYFSEFRAAFVQAGFEVVDCPPLAWLKNSADMKLALDMREALDHPTRFEEFVLLSGDSDFLPALMRLRAHDRRITVLAQDTAKAAYLAAADLVVGLEDFAHQGMGDLPIAQFADPPRPLAEPTRPPLRRSPAEHLPEPADTDPPATPPAKAPSDTQPAAPAPAVPERLEGEPPRPILAPGAEAAAEGPPDAAAMQKAASLVQNLLWGSRDAKALPQDLPAFGPAELAFLLDAIARAQPLDPVEAAARLATAATAAGHSVSAREVLALLRWLLRGYVRLGEPAPADGPMRLARALFVTLLNALRALDEKLTEPETEALRQWTQQAFMPAPLPEG